MKNIFNILPVMLLLATISWATDFETLKTLAENGVARAQLELSFNYEYGLNGAPKNVEESNNWLRKAAEQGNREAQYYFGSNYRNDTFPNYREAIKWYRKSADQGYHPAQFAIGELYTEGKGVPQNDIEALKWLTMSTILQDHGSATKADYNAVINNKFHFAVMLEHGSKIPRDLVMAAKYYLSAAEAGHFTSQKAIGEFYLEGLGIPQDYGAAYFWLNIARSNEVVFETPDMGLQNKCDLAASELSTDKRREVQARCSKWVEEFQKRKASLEERWSGKAVQDNK